MTKRNILIAGTLTLFTIQQSIGALTWQKTNSAVDVGEGVKNVDFSFQAANTGAEAVSIVKIEKSCGCTAVTASKDKIDPADTVTINGTIELAAAGGNSVKTISVQTSDGKTQTLSVAISSPESFRISPGSLSWDNSVEPKSIMFTIPETSKTRLLKSEALSDRFTVVQTTLVENREYQITITPKSGQPTRTALKLTISPEGARPTYVPLSVSTSAPTSASVPPVVAGANPRLDALIEIERNLARDIRSIQELISAEKKQ